MFDQVIVTADGSPLDYFTLPVAGGIAHQLGVPLTLLSVVADTGQVEAWRKAMEGALAARKVSGAKVEVLVGKHAGELIVNKLNERKGALCCMSTHARTFAGEALFGSVTAEVVRSSRVPVLLLGPDFKDTWGTRIQNLFVCLDTSKLSEAIIPVASELALKCSARVRLVEVLPMSRARYTSGSDVAGEASYVAGEADRLKRERGILADWEVLHGDEPAEAIVTHAHGVPGAVIALTTHGRSGLSQMIAGSVAQRAIRRASCPVLVLRP